MQTRERPKAIINNLPLNPGASPGVRNAGNRYERKEAGGSALFRPGQFLLFLSRLPPCGFDSRTYHSTSCEGIKKPSAGTERRDLGWFNYMSEERKSQAICVLGEAMKCLQPAPAQKEPTLGDVFNRLDVIVDQLNKLIEIIKEARA